MANSSTLDQQAPPGGRLYLPQIVALALTLRLIIVALTATHHPAHWFFAQASELDELAHSLLSGQGLSSPFGGHTGPSAFLAPGYPALVALIFKLFQPDTMASAVALMVLQSLFAAGTVAALMLLARRLFTTATANLAGLIWALSLPLLFLPTIFWETSFSIFILTTLILLALQTADHPTAPAWIRLALCALLALAVNPSFATVVLACFLWTLYQTRTAPRTAPVLTLLIFASLCSLWPIRNERTLHAFIPLRSNMGYELWQGNRPGSDGFFNADLHPNTNATELNRYSTLGEVAYMREKSTLAKSAIAANPTRFATLSVKRFFCFWSGVGNHSVWLMVLYTALTTTLGLTGLWLLWISPHLNARRNAILLALPLILLPLPYYLTHPDYRFRCVIDPLLTLLTAYTLTSRLQSDNSLSDSSTPAR